MLGLAAEEQLTAVLTNAVRYADRSDAPDRRRARRRPAGWSRSTRATSTGSTPRATSSPARRWRGSPRRSPGRPGWASAAARRLLAATRRVADRCAVDPRADLGIGRGALPRARRARRRRGAAATRRGVRAARALRGRARPARRCPRPARSAAGSTTSSASSSSLGYPSYFLTVADVVDLIRDMGVRVAARGSGAGSLVNYLLGISGVDPIRHGLLMERFLSPLREALPDIDIDVESARRTEVYERILDRFGGERVACVSMMDTYRVRHAIRDVGAALGCRPARSTPIAKAFPHIRARDATHALRELPELRASRLGERPARPAVPAGRAARRAAAPRRAAPVRRAALRHHAARPHPGRGELARASR